MISNRIAVRYHATHSPGMYNHAQVSLGNFARVLIVISASYTYSEVVKSMATSSAADWVKSCCHIFD